MDNIFSLLYMLYKKIGFNYNPPNYLNVMENYHYHWEYRVITW